MSVAHTDSIHVLSICNAPDAQGTRNVPPYIDVRAGALYVLSSPPFSSGDAQRGGPLLRTKKRNEKKRRTHDPPLVLPPFVRYSG